MCRIGLTLTWTAVFVESIISILVAVLCGGGGVVLISEGPIGMLIGFILSFMILIVSHAMGRKAIDEKLMNANLPLAIRRIALSSALPHIDMPNLGIGDSVKNSSIGRLFSGTDDAEDGEPEQKRHLLPRISWSEPGTISERRMQTIRAKIRQNCEKLLKDADNEDLLALNKRMSRDISDQIEKRLKELAEQVEIPLSPFSGSVQPPGNSSGNPRQKCAKCFTFIRNSGINCIYRYPLDMVPEKQ